MPVDAARSDAERNTNDNELGAGAAEPTSGGSIDQSYNMGHTDRGVMIVISNRDFGDAMPPRKGTDRDVGSLYQKAKKLGFTDIRIEEDKKSKDIIKILKDAAREDHSDQDCFMLVLLSHGEEKGIYGVDGKTVGIDELMQPFSADRCPSLAGKPKIFVIQACRGDKFQSGHRLLQTDAAISDQHETGVVHRIPIFADFLLAYSTIPGFFSWRNQERGSWFVQALADAIDEYGETHEFVQLLTYVNHKVSIEFESSTGDWKTSYKKQVPCFNSMLRKRLLFKPKTTG